ncbi:hypothetical protein TSUD_219930 [Trifolium subterraneum]|uniref:Uncharacterized protein n=1 Tax=Trifolium subterraneum TaxID=3900 RepID=A0A2Z6NSG4_TRISU|nr:hypothetical protein TSUD_219930 [Trifolium subterraneum]
MYQILQAIHRIRTWNQPSTGPASNSDTFSQVDLTLWCNFTLSMKLIAGRLQFSPCIILSPSNLNRLAEELKRNFCDLFGTVIQQSIECDVTVAAGIQFLPAR